MLNDEDRAPWLRALQEAIRHWISQNEDVVLACSALKQRYRDMLRIDRQVRLVYLRGSYSLIASRLAGRTGHFAGLNLLDSQFDALEEPSGDVLVIDVAAPPDTIVARIHSELGLSK